MFLTQPTKQVAKKRKSEEIDYSDYDLSEDDEEDLDSEDEWQRGQTPMGFKNPGMSKRLKVRTEWIAVFRREPVLILSVEQGFLGKFSKDRCDLYACEVFVACLNLVGDVFLFSRSTEEPPFWLKGTETVTAPWKALCLIPLRCHRPRATEQKKVYNRHSQSRLCASARATAGQSAVSVRREGTAAKTTANVMTTNAAIVILWCRSQPQKTKTLNISKKT